MAMVSTQWGKPIKHEEAEEMFQLMLRIKSKSMKVISESLKNEPDALRYYCGRHNATVKEWQNLAFLFDKATLMRILGRVLSNEADGIVIFNGARPKENASEQDGRATVMVFPYKEGIGGQKQENGFVVFTDEGDEHPGSGFKETDSGAATTTDPDKLPLPVWFKIDETEKMLIV